MTTTDGVEGLRDWQQRLTSSVTLPGTEVEFVGLDGGPDGVLRGVASNYAALHGLQTQQVIANARRAEAEGFDAFICGSIDDPGLREARTLVDIPVVGYGQTAMHVAAMMGRKVAIVAFAPPYHALIEENIRLYGLESRILPVIHLDLKYADLADSLDDPSRFIAALEDATSRAAKLGADIVIPGQAPINEALYAAGVVESGGLPVLNGRAIAIAHAEMLVRLRQTIGLLPPRNGYFHARPPEHITDLAYEIYGNLNVSALGRPRGADVEGDPSGSSDS